MLRLLPLLLLAAAPASAQQACPTAADLAVGIVLTRVSGATDTYAGDPMLVAHVEEGPPGARTELLARGYLPISQQDDFGILLTDWGAEPEDLPAPDPLSMWERNVTYTSPSQSVTGTAGIQAGRAETTTIGGCAYTSVPIQLHLGDGGYFLTYLPELGFAFHSDAPQDDVVGIAAAE